MDELTEENPKKEEKRAFYVGLATLAGIILIIVLFIFFIRGCSSDNQTIEEAKKSETATPQVQDSGVAGVETQAPAVTPANKGQTYIVLSGDTLYEIGKKFKVDWHKIAEANGLDNSGALKVGKEIIIPKE